MQQTEGDMIKSSWHEIESIKVNPSECKLIVRADITTKAKSKVNVKYANSLATCMFLPLQGWSDSQKKTKI